jgi:sulfatase maturation enzyme AslB (radical SAM superfamily)
MRALSIQLFRDFWIHTGTACNLSCPFCHEGSKPGDERLQAPTLAELAPLLREAAELGVERFVFTGGEPLILKGIQEILLAALALKPVLVLTNGTAPFIRRSHQLAALRAAPHALTFHVSIDSPEEAVHDAGRGLKNFRKAMEGLRSLHDAGFGTGIVSQPHAQGDSAAVTARFRQLLRRQQLPQDIPVYCMPELGALHSATATVMAAVDAQLTPAASPCCTRGRMLIKRNDALWLTACPMVDDEPAFDRTPDLRAALKAQILPVHRRCTTCLAAGVCYGGA